MARRVKFDGDISELEMAMRSCKDNSEYRRIQCIHLAMLYPTMTAKEIAKITLFSESHVWSIHARYRKEGLEAFIDKRGGRYRQNLTLDQEIELLKPFEEQSKDGGMVVAKSFKKAYEQKLGRSVAESTIYRMLARHDFRKIVPYRRHKKADKEAQEAFKKTSKI